MRFSFINALFDDGTSQTHKQQGGSCNDIYDGDDGNDLSTISKNDDSTLSSASRMSKNLAGNDFTGNDNKIIHDFLNDVEENKEDDELFFGMNDLVSLAGGGGGGTLSNSAATGSGLSCSSSSSRTSTKMIFSPMDKDDCNSAAIPIVATSTSTPIGLLEETCHQLGQIEVDCDDRQQRIYGHGGEKVEPDASASVIIKEEVLVDRFQNADQDDLDAIIYKQVEQLSIKDRMDGCKEVHGIVDETISCTISNGTDVVRRTMTSPPSSPRRTRSPNGISQVEEGMLREFKQALLLNAAASRHQNSTTTCRDAFNLAVSLNANYVYNPRFLLMFLRSEHYNINNSMTRLYKHFEMKLELFGEEL